MINKKTGFASSLLTEVVEGGKCTSCGSCIVSCPFASLIFTSGKPNLVKECNVCGVCTRACPRYKWKMAESEHYVFGKVRDAKEFFTRNIWTKPAQYANKFYVTCV